MMPSDDNSDKLNRFQAAFERGKRGDVGSFAIWLDDHGYNADHVTHEAITDHFRNQPETAANHQATLETIGEYIGFATTQSDTHHLVVTGPTGIGKTQLLHTVLHLLPAIDDDIDGRYFDAATFGDKVNDHFVLEDRVSEVEQLETPVLCLDDCHLDKRIDVSLTDLHDVIAKGVLITTWSPEGYVFNRERVTDTIAPSNELHLDPLPQADTITAINAIDNFLADDATGFDDDAKIRLHELSHGIPGIVVTLVLHALRSAFMNDLEPGSTASIEIAAERLQITDAMDRVYDLSDQKMEILRWILLSLDPRGRSPGDLVDKLDRDKSTVSYHLRTLSDEGFVTSQSEGRRTYYEVPAHVASFIQLRLAQDSQFHAEL